MDMKSICRNQIEEAKKHKWIMGQKLGYDPGKMAIDDWIKNHAEKYREEYNMCLNTLIVKVYDATKEEIMKLRPDIKANELLQLEKIIIEEFTMIWIKESVVNEENKHIKEI